MFGKLALFGWLAGVRGDCGRSGHGFIACDDQFTATSGVENACSCQSQCCAKNYWSFTWVSSGKDAKSCFCQKNCGKDFYDSKSHSGWCQTATNQSNQMNINSDVEGQVSQQDIVVPDKIQRPNVSSDQIPGEGELVVGLLEFAWKELPVKKLISWIGSKLVHVFTHKRTISVNIKANAPMYQFHHLYNYADDGVDFVWDQGDAGLHLTFHNDGAISGCQAFAVGGCDYRLFVAASNPFAGHNKIRVAWGPSTDYDEGGHRDCKAVWKDMSKGSCNDGACFGEVEGSARFAKNEWYKYDNPSTATFYLGVPEQCKKHGNVLNATVV